MFLAIKEIKGNQVNNVELLTMKTLVEKIICGEARLEPGQLLDFDLTGMTIGRADGSLPCGLFADSGHVRITDELLYKELMLSTPHGKLMLATGDSMIEAGINEGDTLVIDPEYLASNGCVVVARYEGEMTVKYYYEVKDSLLLVPANRAYCPIEVLDRSRLEIIGVVTEILHSAPKMSRAEMTRRVADSKRDMKLRTYVERTIVLGYMDAQGQWTARATNELKALWIDAVAERLEIENKWEWATERWGLPSLKTYYYRVTGSSRFEEFLGALKKIFY